MTTNQTHQINETHLGTEATPDEARRLAEILTGMGYPSEYNGMQGVSAALKNYETPDGENIEIPQAIWDTALAQLVAAR